MILYTCANCRKELEIDDSLGGSRVRCPHCRNVEIAPAAGAQPTRAERVPAAKPRRAPEPTGAPESVGADRATALGLPPDSGPEAEVMRVHPVMFRARPTQMAGVLLVLIGGAGLAAYAWLAPGMAKDRWVGYPGIGLAVIGLAGCLWWKFQSLGTTLIITNKRTTLRQGFFSKATKELLHDQVQDVQITQTFAERMLKVGTLGLDGGGTDQVEMVVPDLPDPMRLRQIIDAYRDID